MAPTITTIPAVTLQQITPSIADNVTLGNATFAFLRQKGRMKLEPGADYLQEPIQWAENATAQSYTGYGALDNTPQDELTAATYNWKQYSAAATMSGLERLRNANEHGVIKVWAAKLAMAEEGLISLLDRHVHASSATKTADDILGLDEFIENEVSPNDTVGGIARASEAWWRNKYKAGTVATITQDCRSAIRLASEGRERPDFGICSTEPFEAIINQNAGKQRLINQAMMDLSYDNVVIDGVTLMWNRNCLGNGITTPSATGDGTSWVIYFGNSKFLRLRIHQDRNFSARGSGEGEQPIAQDAYVSYILFAGAMTLSNSRFQCALEIIG